MAVWTMALGAVPRTGQSALTDDELVICDALFSAPVPSRLLARETFGEMFNLPYEHGIADASLQTFLEGMQERGILEAKPDVTPPTDRPVFRLTDWRGRTMFWAPLIACDRDRGQAGGAVTTCPCRSRRSGGASGAWSSSCGR